MVFRPEKALKLALSWNGNCFDRAGVSKGCMSVHEFLQKMPPELFLRKAAVRSRRLRKVQKEELVLPFLWLMGKALLPWPQLPCLACWAALGTLSRHKSAPISVRPRALQRLNV